MFSKKFLILIFTFLLLHFVFSYDYFISNSADWHDMYSLGIFALLSGKTPEILFSQDQAISFYQNLPDSGGSVFLLTSENASLLPTLKDKLVQKGYEVEEYTSKNFHQTNIDLAKKAGTTNFIVVSPERGSPAIAVIPYAAITNSFVIFADSSSVNEVVSFFDSVGVNRLLIYGDVDREVYESLKKYHPEVINTGSKYSDNIKIVEEFFKIKPYTTQVILVTGNYLEKPLFQDKYPIMFSDEESLPDSVKQFLRNRNIRFVSILEPTLVSVGIYIKRKLGINAFLLVAQTPYGIQGGKTYSTISVFRAKLPEIKVDLNVEDVYYNLATGSVEIHYSNPSSVQVAIKSTVSAFENDKLLSTSSMEKPELIPPKDKLIVSIPLDIKKQLEEKKTIRLRLITEYGESAKSLEKILDLDFNEIKVISREIGGKIELLEASLSCDRRRIILKYKSNTDMYIKPYVYLLLGGLEHAITLKDVVHIKANEIKSIELPITYKDKIIRLMPGEIVENKRIKVKTFYGLSTTLAYFYYAEVPLKFFDWSLWILIGLILVVLNAILWLYREEDRDEGKIFASLALGLFVLFIALGISMDLCFLGILNAGLQILLMLFRLFKILTSRREKKIEEHKITHELENIEFEE